MRNEFVFFLLALSVTMHTAIAFLSCQEMIAATELCSVTFWIQLAFLCSWVLAGSAGIVLLVFCLKSCLCHNNRRPQQVESTTTSLSTPIFHGYQPYPEAEEGQVWYQQESGEEEEGHS